MKKILCNLSFAFWNLAMWRNWKRKTLMIYFCIEFFRKLNRSSQVIILWSHFPLDALDFLCLLQCVCIHHPTIARNRFPTCKLENRYVSKKGEKQIKSREYCHIFESLRIFIYCIYNFILCLAITIYVIQSLLYLFSLIFKMNRSKYGYHLGYWCNSYLNILIRFLNFNKSNSTSFLDHSCDFLEIWDPKFYSHNFLGTIINIKYAYLHVISELKGNK